MSCSVAQHLLFCSEPRLCRLTGEDGLLKLLGVDSGPLCYAPFASPLGWSGCGVVCIEPLCRSASVICTSPRLCRPYGQDGLLAPRLSTLSRSVALPLFFSASSCFRHPCMARMVRVSVASPPSFVELLSPCISAGPVAGSSALSRFCRSVPVILCLAALMPPILRGWAFCLAARLAFELLVSRLLSFR